MADSFPPPLPNSNGCCGNRFPSFLAGLVVGAAAVGIAATIFIRNEHARAETALADAHAALHIGGVPQAGGMLNNLFGGEPSKSNDAPAQTEASRIKSLGDEAVDDLRQGRLLAVYRLTTKEYQASKKQEDFEKMIAGVQHLSAIYANPQQRESKVRKANDGDGYEYYCSSPPGANAGNVVFSFIFVPGEHGVWRISNVQVKYVNR